MTDTLPNWGPARPMSTAPRDGTRILALAELASFYQECAINGAVVVRWAAELNGWQLLPYAPSTRIDGEPTGWWPLPEQMR